MQPVVRARVLAKVAGQRQDIEHLRKRQRHHRQIDALDPQREHTKDHTLEQGERQDRHERPSEGPVEILADQDGDNIATGAKKHSMPERQYARET